MIALPLMRTCLMLTAFTCALSTGAKAEPSFWGKVSDNLTPNQQGDMPPPDETLKAPFATDATPVPNPTNPLMRIYKGAGADAKAEQADIRDLTVAHRSDDQMREWVSEAVAQALSFDTNSLKGFGTVLRPTFGAQGLKEFKTYLTDMGIPAYLASTKKTLGTYVERPPVVVKQSRVNGFYTWILDVPVLMSYRDTENLRSKPMVRHQSIRVTITRTDKLNPYKDGMMITGWSARPSDAAGDIARFR
ncbi:MAG: DotI/IcmL/TraM family protein [Pseudobdellovibrionaceae bacterium]